LFDLLCTDIFGAGSLLPALATTRAGSHGYVYELDVPCQVAGRPSAPVTWRTCR
jgi:hypothetical protein